MKKLMFLITLILSITLLASCGGGGGSGSTDDSGDSGSSFRVQLIVSDGISILDGNVKTVNPGDNAEFLVSFPDDMIYKGVSAGDDAIDYTFDLATGKLVVLNVTKNLRVQLNGEKAAANATKITFNFKGADGDSSDLANGVYISGTSVTLVAGDKSRIFEGWSFGGTLKGGGTLISTERKATFTLGEEYANNGMCYVFSNYASKNLMKYSLNGGEVNTSTDNFLSTKYYTATVVGDDVSVLFNTDYYEKVGVGYTFWDDGTFYRDGYILKEYNTSPDGTGTGYSLGSKYPISDGGILYCIWEKDTSHSDFTYTNIKIPLPEGASFSGASNWVVDGIMITSYTGDAKNVTIPEKIDGKYVIAIGSGAFRDKSLETLVMGRRMEKIEDGAFIGCTKISTIYYPDGIAYIGNDCLDFASYTSLKHLYVNATLAPRYSKSEGGCFAIKFTRLLANANKNRVIVISGSSSYCGLSVEYLEALLDGERCVVNLGTTRTTQIYMYLEAMQTYAHEGDVILYAPENSIYEMGEPRLYWKTLRDLEGMYNIFRSIDISGYENVFGAFSEINIGTPEGAYDPLAKGRYARGAGEYGDVMNTTSFNEYGEYYTRAMEEYCVEENYKAVYEITLNNRFKSILEGEFSTSNPSAEPWQSSEKWCSADEAKYVKNLNRAINAARSTGAEVYFTYAPIDYSAICKEAKVDLDAWLLAYDSFIMETYDFDGILGNAKSYIFDHKYFYNNAYHTNNYGRVYRTYQMYLDLAALFGKSETYTIMQKAFSISGCKFEQGATTAPLTPVNFD